MGAVVDELETHHCYKGPSAADNSLRVFALSRKNRRRDILFLHLSKEAVVRLQRPKMDSSRSLIWNAPFIVSLCFTPPDAVSMLRVQF